MLLRNHSSAKELLCATVVSLKILMVRGFCGLSVLSMAIFVFFGVFWIVLVRMFASVEFLGKLSFMFVGVRWRIMLTSFSLIFSAL